MSQNSEKAIKFLSADNVTDGTYFIKTLNARTSGKLRITSTGH